MFSTTPTKHQFSPEELKRLDKTKIPKHVAIVPDGNRRWAKKHLLAITLGHETGAENIVETVRAAKQLGIKNVTFYLFSTENWNREKYEVNALMNLYEKFLVERSQELIDESIRFHTIGDLSPLPASLQNQITITKNATKDCNQINLIAALNYGSRNEITRAFNSILSDIAAGKIDKNAVSEQTIAAHLDTAAWPDPELLIRTSGEIRLSNYLLWQICYSEIYISDILWPDFKPCHMLDAVKYYQTRDRRLGGG
jgi:undecaprenyl diphosphate synthase